MIPCEKHPDRDGILTVDLPSIGIRRYMCLECRMAFEIAMARPVPPYTDYAQYMIDRDRGKNVNANRAYATGLGKEAHYEAQEAGRFDREFQESKPHAKLRKYL